jgi:hypothetical protein
MIILLRSLKSLLFPSLFSSDLIYSPEVFFFIAKGDTDGVMVKV